MAKENTANIYIGWMIQEDALKLGYEEFFKNHVLFYRDGKDYESPRELAKDVVRNIPDYCSFDAFFACFEDRFKAWHETGNVDGIQQSQED
jgi:hypothetical protein